VTSKVHAALAALLLSLWLPAAAHAQSCAVPLLQFGPVNPSHGFPDYYQDSTLLGLQPCLDFVCDPALGVPDPNKPVSFPDNFPNEFFYQRAIATMNGPNGQTFLRDGRRLEPGETCRGENPIRVARRSGDRGRRSSAGPGVKHKLAEHTLRRI
jgi:hypothetical protein